MFFVKKSTGLIVLLLVALVFGLAFAFQSIGANLIGPFQLNGFRFLLGALVISPFALKKDNTDNKLLFKAALLDGILLFLATNLQQYAITYTSVGKAGFLTALYIVLVPFIAALFLNKKLNINAIIAVILALIGLILLCNLSLNDLNIEKYDFYLIIVALLFSFQILLVEEYVNKINPIKMSCLAFLITGLLSLIFSFIFESFNFEIFKSALPSILYLGIMSTGLGYTLQTVGQKYIASNEASLIMSLESVFSIIGGYFILNQVLTTKELIGCLIMFLAVIICQLPNKK